MKNTRVNILKKVLKIYKNNFYFNIFLVLCFAIISFYFNYLPQNSIVAAGDFYQLFALEKHYSRYFYEWINQVGQGSFNSLSSTGIYYTIIYFLEKFSNLSNFSVANFIQFFFFLGSFFSFKYFLKSSFNLTRSESVLFSLSYAFNPVTFNILSYSWGYNHHSLYYIFLPLLLGSFYKTIKSDKNNFYKFLAEFGIVSFLALPILNNITFGFLLAMFFVFITVFNFEKKDKYFSFKKNILTAVIATLTFYWYFILNYLFLFIFASKLDSNKVIGNLSDWLLNTSSNFSSVFMMGGGKSFFVYNEEVYSSISLVFTFLIITFFLFKNKSAKIFPMVIILITVSLAVRAYGPLKDINLFIYQLPGVNSLRSPDKLIFTLPIIFLSVIIYYYLYAGLKYKKYFLYLILLPITFFIFGNPSNILMKETSNIGGLYKKNITIPQEYFKAKEHINSDNKDVSIINLPYSVSTSVNWVNYPMWNFLGHDITHLLYNKRMIFTNSFDNPSYENRMSFKLDEDPLKSEKDFLSRLQKFGTEYIFIHKDIDPIWLKDSRMYINILDKSNFARKIESNNYFDLYKIKDEFVRPHIYSSTNLTFQKTNPTHYSVSVKNIRATSSLEFLESYHPKWSVYISKYSGNSECTNTIFNYQAARSMECGATNKFLSGIEFSVPFNNKLQLSENAHYMAQDWANGWMINEKEVRSLGAEYYRENPDGTIDVNVDIYFKPQTYFIFGIIVSFGTFLLLVFSFVYMSYIKPKKQKIIFPSLPFLSF